MKRIFIASKGNRDGLAQMFRAELPDFQLITEASEIAGGNVPYIVVGRPDPGVIGRVPGLQVVLSLNAGVEHLLASGEVPEEIPIVRMVDYGLAEGMSEWVLAHTLAWHRNILLYRDMQPRREWKPLVERLARDRTVTVLGAGELGGPVAAHLVAFNFQTRVWSRSGRTVPGATSFAGREQLIAAATGADVLINLLPLTAETRDLIDASVFAAMNEGGFFINGARGGQVVDADLIAALDAGRLGGAALDVFRTEPLPQDDPLWTHPKILISPHVAAPTHPHTAVVEMAANIRRHQAGEPLHNVVDRAAGY
jgi:glyoxylate/hydroxypyruvate reductase A